MFVDVNVGSSARTMADHPFVHATSQEPRATQAVLDFFRKAGYRRLGLEKDIFELLQPTSDHPILSDEVHNI